MSKDSQWIAGINAVASAIEHDADNVRERYRFFSYGDAMLLFREAAA